MPPNYTPKATQAHRRPSKLDPRPPGRSLFGGRPAGSRDPRGPDRPPPETRDGRCLAACALASTCSPSHAAPVPKYRPCGAKNRHGRPGPAQQALVGASAPAPQSPLLFSPGRFHNTKKLPEEGGCWCCDRNGGHDHDPRETLRTVKIGPELKIDLGKMPLKGPLDWTSQGL